MNKDVLIIGGGPAGLLTSYHLKRFGVKPLIIERNRLGQSWRNMRDYMTMLSPADVRHDLTSLTFDNPISSAIKLKGPFATKEEFVTYLEFFAQENFIDISENKSVSTISAVEKGYSVSTKEGVLYNSSIVVVATGVAGNPFIPDIKGIKNNPLVTHSSKSRSLEEYRGKKVLIVGAGNSGAELAIEISGVATVTLAARSKLRYYSKTDDLSNIRGLSESLLKELIKFKIIELKEDCMITSIDGGKVSFSNGSDGEFDEVIFATGYMPGLPEFVGVQVDKTADGYPVVSPNCESVSAKGLYFSGPLAHNNRYCSFIHCFRPMVEPMALEIAERLGH
ncbi:MAG: NAD(P)-binding domain-containing protein [bacterium]|nr:NAD(P)-binding domain-containing protein [bacterium]